MGWEMTELHEHAAIGDLAVRRKEGQTQMDGCRCKLPLRSGRIVDDGGLGGQRPPVDPSERERMIWCRAISETDRRPRLCR